MREEPNSNLSDFRKRSFRDIAEADKRYRTVLNSIDEGFVLAEIVWDKDGNAQDYVILEINIAFGQLLGAKSSDVLGKSASQLYPNLERHMLVFLGKIARTGEQSRIESYSKENDRYYEV